MADTGSLISAGVPVQVNLASFHFSSDQTSIVILDICKSHANTENVDIFWGCYIRNLNAKTFKQGSNSHINYKFSLHTNDVAFYKTSPLHFTYNLEIGKNNWHNLGKTVPSNPIKRSL